MLSFPLADDVQPFLLGDVVISLDTAARQAQRRRHSLREELQILLIHGILHLLGYDHEVSRSEAIRMHRKEREIREMLNEHARPLYTSRGDVVEVSFWAKAKKKCSS